MNKKMRVAILGATGTVGQKFISLLNNHPYFEISELVASERSAGKCYREACSWKQNAPIPGNIADMKVLSLDDALESPILFSGLDAAVAGDAELSYAERGHVVISNSRNHRMGENIPLVIPEINPDHFSLIAAQEWDGAIITNSNCSTMFLAMALAPLHETFGLEAVQVSTMQAISGAGYPGVASCDILGNVVPYIGGEEEKMETEPQKILGTLAGERVVHADFAVSAQCNRVPVVDGHTETVSFSLRKKASLEELHSVMSGFRGLPQELNLPFAPEHPILMMDEADRPQPARDVWLENGMATMVGRLRPCNVLDYRMVIMGHNTVRGAAGAAILNAETMLRLGLFGDNPAEDYNPAEMKCRSALLASGRMRDAVIAGC
jgi:aspartate-semialdehyde dehydrogenase